MSSHAQRILKNIDSSLTSEVVQELRGLTKDLFSNAEVPSSARKLLLLILSQLEQLKSEFAKLCERIAQSTSEMPEVMTVKQVSLYLEKAPFTVREWCRHGRIKSHRASKRGRYSEYRISADAIRYYLEHGLLPSNTSYRHPR
jgi:hypothetical protein